MDSEIQLVSDGDGLAVIGDAAAVERFLAAEGLPSKDLELPRLGEVLGTGGAAAQAGSELAANSGRWVKLTKESAKMAKSHGLRESSKSGLSTGVVKGSKGQIKGFVEFAKGPGSLLKNPAVLAGAAGVMAQLAMQQTMDEITDYLVAIDEKLDDVRRAQTDQVLARMDAVDLAVREAMSVRDTVGRVSEVTWSKVQGTSGTILDTQAYALRELKSLAEKLERQTGIGDLSKATSEAESDVQKWLAVLARCFQLSDAVAVLELDRVLDASPEELDRHRLGLKAARAERVELISRHTERLLDRMAAAASTANTNVLRHPSKAPAVVQSSNDVAAAVVDFHGLLGIHRDPQSLDARPWSVAARDARDKVVERGADGVGVARRIGTASFGRAKGAKAAASRRIGERTRRRPVDEGGD